MKSFFNQFKITEQMIEDYLTSCQQVDLPATQKVVNLFNHAIIVLR